MLNRRSKEAIRKGVKGKNKLYEDRFCSACGKMFSRIELKSEFIEKEGNVERFYFKCKCGSIETAYYKNDYIRVKEDRNKDFVVRFRRFLDKGWLEKAERNRKLYDKTVAEIEEEKKKLFEKYEGGLFGIVDFK